MAKRTEKNEKIVQYFSPEALERSRDLSPEAIARFLEDYRLMFSDGASKTKLRADASTTEPMPETRVPIIIATKVIACYVYSMRDRANTN